MYYVFNKCVIFSLVIYVQLLHEIKNLIWLKHETEDEDYYLEFSVQTNNNYITCQFQYGCNKE